MNTLKAIIPLSVALLVSSAICYKPATVTESKTAVLKTNPVMGLTSPGDTTKWVAPETAAAVKNPIASSEGVVTEGTVVYKKNCRSCHGKDGDGQGAEAADLKTKVTDFRNPDFAIQSDGSMFWKIQKGRGDMTAFEKDLTENDIWNVIHYIRTFSQPVKK